MFIDRELRIIAALQQLSQLEGRLQATYQRLATAQPDERLSFLRSLGEWNDCGRSLEQLLNH
jgi:hypothetical protein